MPEHPPKIETEKPYSSKIELHFFRHSIKETDVVSETDQGVKISKAGRKLAKEDSFKNANLSQSVGFGSTRIRAQETAGFMMAGGRDDINEDDTLETLREKLDAELKVGSKLGIDDRLNFNESRSGGPVDQMLYEAMNRGEYAKAMIEDSDRVTQETGEGSRSTYSFKAAKIAGIVRKYMKIAPRWDQLVNKKDSKYTDTLERYFGTHQGMSESFLAKVISKTEGEESKADFIKSFGKQGFDYNKGFDMEILTDVDGKQILRIRLNVEQGDSPRYVFDREIPLRVIEEIIEEEPKK